MTKLLFSNKLLNSWQNRTKLQLNWTNNYIGNGMIKLVKKNSLKLFVVKKIITFLFLNLKLFINMLSLKLWTHRNLRWVVKALKLEGKRLTQVTYLYKKYSFFSRISLKVLSEKSYIDCYKSKEACSFNYTTYNLDFMNALECYYFVWA